MIIGKDKIRLEELEKDFVSLAKEHQAIVMLLFKKVKPMIEEFEARHSNDNVDRGLVGDMFV